MKKALIIIGGLLVIGVLFFGSIGLGIMSSYNGLVAKSVVVDTAQSQIETQYQRRFDLIPALIGATKGYLQQEQKVFGDIAEARTHYAGAPAGSPEKIASAGQLDGALARLMVIVENYPQLKSDVTVRSLMDELAGTENRINVARQRYNETVQDYNTSIRVFPRSILAGMFGFKERPFYKSESGAEKAVPVNLQ